MARSGFSFLRRRRDAPSKPPRAAAPRPTAQFPAPHQPAPAPEDRYTPRRRYPWHDDPDYDPAAHRRTPPPAPAWTPPSQQSWTPGPPDARDEVPWTAAGPPPVATPPRGTPAPAPGRPTDSRPTDSRPTDSRPTDSRPTGGRPTDGRPEHGRPEHGRPTDARRTGADPTDAPTAAGRTTAAPTSLGPVTDAPITVGGDQPGTDQPAADRPTALRMPRKLTVTRVAALRSRQITGNGIRAFHRATTADGADRSGLTALTYATMFTYAVDAAVAVALANTLFFAAAKAESVTNVALYLAITVAPFAVVAPVIGPLLDRLQRGRRAALAVSFAGRAALAVVMALNYDNWGLYPAALGVMVLSKSYHVLKAAVTPRVLPSAITLATTNSRLTTFGMVAGGVFGAVAAGILALSGSPGALFFTAALAVAGTLLCLRIPRWVESTAGEVPAALRSTVRGRRQPISRGVVVALWGNGSMRFLTGFLTLFVAFTVRAQAGEDPTQQLFLIGIVGAAAGIGSFGGNAAGSRQRFSKVDTVIVGCIAVAVVAAVLAAVVPGIATAAIVALVASTCSALAKVCLDAVIQRDLPEESRASAFGRSETVLQLAWVFGGALGVLLPHDTYGLGFVVASAMVALGGIQTALIARAHSILPFLAPRSEPARTRT